MKQDSICWDAESLLQLAHQVPENLHLLGGERPGVPVPDEADGNRVSVVPFAIRADHVQPRVLINPPIAHVESAVCHPVAVPDDEVISKTVKPPAAVKAIYLGGISSGGA